MVINIFNLPSNKISLELKDSKYSKKVKGLTQIDQNTIQYSVVAQEGEYSLNIINKTFQKINIKIDKKPVIKLVSKPNLKSGKILNFKFTIKDENLRFACLELSSKKFEEEINIISDESKFNKIII